MPKTSIGWEDGCPWTRIRYDFPCRARCNNNNTTGFVLLWLPQRRFSHFAHFADFVPVAMESHGRLVQGGPRDFFQRLDQVWESPMTTGNRTEGSLCSRQGGAPSSPRSFRWLPEPGTIDHLACPLRSKFTSSAPNRSSTSQGFLK